MSGVWEGILPQVPVGSRYKYHVVSRYNDYEVDKGDPFAFCTELSPRTASVVWDLHYDWHDQPWMRTRGGRQALQAPLAIYEMHLGSWRRCPAAAAGDGAAGKGDLLPSPDGRGFCSYRELAPMLADYLRDRGFTHVEFLPLDGTSVLRFLGIPDDWLLRPHQPLRPPQDLMYLIDYLHQHEIGVILDWVPSHFTTDEHGLGYFDGTHLYEHADPRRGVHPEWHSYLFNYGRNEVRAFLLSCAHFWLDKYHIDGLRTDAVASMLYLDYSRREGQWLPNRFGGRENLEAIDFLRTFNEKVYASYPDTVTIAEESTAWPMVSRPLYVGGLGFGYKWDMGWMHDTLEYMRQDPVFRKFHHNQVTFRMVYAFSENFILPLSHDEVVYGKGSLLGKMPGDRWRKFANLRLLLGYMYAQPGKKLLFMGGEFGQVNEWQHDGELDWQLLDEEPHRRVQQWIDDLNRAYRREPALHKYDCSPQGFQWIDGCDADQSVLTFLRKGDRSDADILVACNFTPGAADELPRRRDAGRLLGRDSQQRRHALWGQRLGQFGSSGIVACRFARLARVDQPYAAAAGGGVLAARR